MILLQRRANPNFAKSFAGLFIHKNSPATINLCSLNNEKGSSTIVMLKDPGHSYLLKHPTKTNNNHIDSPIFNGLVISMISTWLIQLFIGFLNLHQPPTTNHQPPPTTPDPLQHSPLPPQWHPQHLRHRTLRLCRLGWHLQAKERERERWQPTYMVHLPTFTFKIKWPTAFSWMMGIPKSLPWKKGWKSLNISIWSNGIILHLHLGFPEIAGG